MDDHFAKTKDAKLVYELRVEKIKTEKKLITISNY